MVPVVLAELFSEPTITDEEAELLFAVQVLGLKPGYWWRTGKLCSSVLAQGRRAALADSLIAQCCIDAARPPFSGRPPAGRAAAGIRLAATRALSAQGASKLPRHAVPLITRDHDFIAFVEAAGLEAVLA